VRTLVTLLALITITCTSSAWAQPESPPEEPVLSLKELEQMMTDLTRDGNSLEQKLSRGFVFHCAPEAFEDEKTECPERIRTINAETRQFESDYYEVNHQVFRTCSKLGREQCLRVVPREERLMETRTKLLTTYQRIMGYPWSPARPE